MKKKDKVIFVLCFAIFYVLLLIFGIFVLGNVLLGIEEKIIHLLLRNSVNYNAFDFVVYCSGIVSISAYLGVILGFLVVRLKPRLKVVVASIVLLWIINLLRIIIVMLSEKLGIERSTHLLSWFLMALVIVWFIKISNK